MDELKLTIQEAQDMLLLSQSSVYSWIDKGKLQSIETPGGKLIIISRKEAEEIKNFNLKSRRNKVAKQGQQRNSKNITPEENFENLTSEEISILNPEILENSEPQTTQKPSDDLTLRLIGRIEELALDAGRFKQLEILRNEEKEHVKFWQEKYHELNAELKKKDLEINALNLQIEALKAKLQNPIFFLFKKH